MTGHPGVAARPAYTLSKLTGTLLFQLIAQTVQPEKLQVVSFHPGLIYNDAWQQMGLPKDDNFDDGEIDRFSYHLLCVYIVDQALMNYIVVISRTCWCLCSLGCHETSCLPSRPICLGSMGYRGAFDW